MVRTILSVLAVHRPFISTLPTQHTTFISLLDLSLLDLSPLRPMPNLKKFCHSLRHEMISHLFPFLTSISKLALRLSISRLRLVYWSILKIANDLPIFASYAFVIVSFTWLAYFLSHDYLSYINSLLFLFIFYFSLTKGQCSKR